MIGSVQSWDSRGFAVLRPSANDETTLTVHVSAFQGDPPVVGQRASFGVFTGHDGRKSAVNRPRRLRDASADRAPLKSRKPYDATDRSGPFVHTAHAPVQTKFLGGGNSQR